MNRGVAFAASAYTLWGVFPLYFHLLRAVPAFEVLMQRVVWSLLLLVVLLIARRHWRWLRETMQAPRILGRYVASALLIGVNWYVYIWSVQNDHVLDASLGYFITPLISVLLGRVVLGERPRPIQWVALAIATVGVLWLALRAGHEPWISLVLAMTFGAYGLMKKTAPLGALEGLALETALLFPVAIIALVWLASQGQSALMTGGDTLRWLLVATGPLTALPLLLFAAGARRIPLATLGLLQYISPTLQLLIGVLVFGEAFGGASAIGYTLIWFALSIYAVEGIVRGRRLAFATRVAR
jgi:chloramphenicol-sensitive protein RarD